MHRMFSLQDVCHVLRDHQMHDKFIGPRFLIHVAALEMHPLDTEDRLEELRNTRELAIATSKVLHQVCPESIEITDNGIIPLKERVVDKFLRSVRMVLALVETATDRQPSKPV